MLALRYSYINVQKAYAFDTLKTTHPVRKTLLLKNPKIHHCVQNSPSLEPALSQLNSASTVTPKYFSKINFDIFLACTLMSPVSPLPLRFFYRKLCVPLLIRIDSNSLLRFCQAKMIQVFTELERYANDTECRLDEFCFLR